MRFLFYATLLFFSIAISTPSYCQLVTPQQIQYLDSLKKELELNHLKQQEKITAYYKVYPKKESDSTRQNIQLQGFTKNNHPIFYGTDNANAALTVGTTSARTQFGLDGTGITIGEWDGGEVRGTHVEITGRVNQIDNPSSLSDHATHVAGTMIALGIQAAAKGMAFAAEINAYDFNNDDAEMVGFATASGILSNHSYGTITGWREMSNGTWRWYGDTAISGVEDYRFGFYTQSARNWDLIANNAPYYLIVKSAGNDRNDEPPATVVNHEVWGNGTWVNSTVARPADGGVDGYDCISSSGNAKNILTVGAVNDIVNGYTGIADVIMSSFSGWGPTDDGRIKPDIVANGVSLYSTGSLNNTDYYFSSGTSMSAPNATGSIALLQEMYHDSTTLYMPSSLVKALVIHTARPAGPNPGPDYTFGWGLLAIDQAAELLADTTTNKTTQAVLTSNDSLVYQYYSDGTQPLRATMAWNDPAAQVLPDQLDPVASMLVNDLDMRIVKTGTNLDKKPWVLNPASPSSAATKADNFRDNVEQVSWFSPTPGWYTITIKHKGSLTGGSQNVSLVVSGVSSGPSPFPNIVSITPSSNTICEGDSITFTSVTSGGPSQFMWTLSNGATSTDSIPTFPGIAGNGNFTAQLIVTNPFGSDTLTTSFTVNPTPQVSLAPLGQVCLNGGLVSLSGGAPIGGSYSGIGVTGMDFDPTVLGIGTTPITYTFTAFGCSGTATQNISVTNSSVTPNIQGLNPSYCVNDSAVVLFGQPSGGILSGSGIADSLFTPGLAGVGTHTISYTVSGNCAGSYSQDVTIYNRPTISPILGPQISSQNTVASYQVAPLNGASYSWQITGGTFNTNSNNQITVTWGAGTTGNLQAVITDINGCKDTTNVQVELWVLSIDSKQIMELQAYPNPVQTNLQVNGGYALSKSLTYTVYDITGKTVQTGSFSVTGGAFTRSIPVSSLGSGLYRLVIYNDQQPIGQVSFVKN